jgi:hypothetical protein
MVATSAGEQVATVVALRRETRCAIAPFILDLHPRRAAHQVTDAGLQQGFDGHRVARQRVVKRSSPAAAAQGISTVPRKSQEKCKARITDFTSPNINA